jgi:hypothetical protein
VSEPKTAPSARRSSVESRKAPKRVPPVVIRASVPSTESPNTTTARAIPPCQIHPCGMQMTATATEATVPATVTMFGVTPSRARTRASGVKIALVIDRP